MIPVWEIHRGSPTGPKGRWHQSDPVPAPGPFSLWNPPHDGGNCLLWAALGDATATPVSHQAWETLFTRVRVACGVPAGVHLEAVEGLAALQDTLQAQGQVVPSFEVWELQEERANLLSVRVIFRLVGDGPTRIVAHRDQAFLGVHAPSSDTDGNLDEE